MDNNFNPITSPLESLSYKECLRILKSNNDWIVQEAPGAPWYWWLSSLAWIRGLTVEKYPPRYFITYGLDDLFTLVVSYQVFLKQAKRLIDQEMRGKKIIENWINKWQIMSLRFSSQVEKIKKIDLGSVSEKKLINLFQDFCKIYYQAEILPLSNEFIIPYSDLILRQVIARDSKHAQAIAELVVPEKKSFIQTEEEELMRIKILSGVRRLKALKRHLDKWYFIGGGYDGPHAQNLKLLEKRLLKPEVKPVVAEIKLRKINFSKKIQTVIRTTRLVAEWKDDRKKNNLIGSWVFDQFARTLSRKYSVPYRLVRYATPRDFSRIIAKDKNLKYEIKQRIKTGTAWGMNELSFSGIFTGEQYSEIKKIISQLKKAETTLSGVIANPGRVIGKIKIIHNPAKESLQTGEILLTSMTRPEFVPLMKNARAVLCDEGGILFHAAIISRELNIPCLVGLGHAMKSFKNGDMVEVNANHGWVRKIK